MSRMDTSYEPGTSSWSRLGNFLKTPQRVVMWNFRKILIGAWRKRAKRILSDKVDLGFLDRRPAGALPPDYCDLLFLYELVRSRKPSVIFEFGSGCSTSILAQAALQNHKENMAIKPYVYSLEADSFWAEEAGKMLTPDLQDYCEIRHTPLELKTTSAGTFVVHGNLPNSVPDFIYLDGPSGPKDSLEWRIAGDVLSLESQLKLGFFMVIDGRWENISFLKKKAARKYSYFHRWFFNNSLIELVA